MGWLEQNGAVVDGVEIIEVGERGGELGLRATKELKLGDVTLTIPRKLMMSLDTAKNSEIGRLIEKDLMLQKMNNVALSLHLLLEKTSPAYFWTKFQNTMIKDYFTFEEYRWAVSTVMTRQNS